MQIIERPEEGILWVRANLVDGRSSPPAPTASLFHPAGIVMVLLGALVVVWFVQDPCSFITNNRHLIQCSPTNVPSQVYVALSLPLAFLWGIPVATEVSHRLRHLKTPMNLDLLVRSGRIEVKGSSNGQLLAALEEVEVSAVGSTLRVLRPADDREVLVELDCSPSEVQTVCDKIGMLQRDRLPITDTPRSRAHR